MNLEDYQKIREGNAAGFYRQKRGLISVSGGEAVQFLDGLITNDVKTLADRAEMLAAFPNAKGRLLAVAGVRRQNEEFLFETEGATRQKIFENLHRFTFAGDFVVEDLSDDFVAYRFFGRATDLDAEKYDAFSINGRYFVPAGEADRFEQDLRDQGFVKVSEELYEVFRIEEGIPRYGVDMDEETVVPETGLKDLISYEKGCYIGQEVIARIHFRGRVAKELKGLIFEENDPKIGPQDELRSADDKNAGFITSAAFSPKLEKTIALAYVRNAFSAEGTELRVGNYTAKVKNLPFV